MASGRPGPSSSWVAHKKACRNKMELAIQAEEPARWEKYCSEDGHMWWWNSKSGEWFFEETGSTKLPVRECGGSCGKFGGCYKSGSDDCDSDGEESTATGAGSTSVGDSSSASTVAVHPLVPTTTVTGPRLPPIDEDNCTHRAFYYNMYSAASGNHEPPKGVFEV